ncbi:hypothetical protein F4779DRAFT_50512 [Xylariaceae sp. FL0662B]|nr:hypothetical protein F4779DRAFT_50512 [Xylariaceae sp. FL0662B]
MEVHEARAIPIPDISKFGHARKLRSVALRKGKRASRRTALTTSNSLSEKNSCMVEAFKYRWVVTRPKEFHPVKTVDAKPFNFPHTLCVPLAGRLLNQLHHTACILILIELDAEAPEADDEPRVRWAPRCGTRSRSAVSGRRIRIRAAHINNAIQSLWLIGR